MNHLLSVYVGMNNGEIKIFHKLLNIKNILIPAKKAMKYINASNLHKMPRLYD